MKSERDLDEYCHSLLDIQSVVHKQFLLDLKKRHRLCKFVSSVFFFCVCVLTRIKFYSYDLVNQKPITSVDDAAARFTKKMSKIQEKAEENTNTTDKKQKVNELYKFFCAYFHCF